MAGEDGLDLQLRAHCFGGRVAALVAGDRRPGQDAQGVRVELGERVDQGHGAAVAEVFRACVRTGVGEGQDGQGLDARLRTNRSARAGAPASFGDQNGDGGQGHDRHAGDE